MTLTACCVRRMRIPLQFISNIANIANFAHVGAQPLRQASSKVPRWQIMSALCLERLPVISRTLNDLESRFLHLQQQLEVEKSVLSDHEMRHKDDIQKAEMKLLGEVEETEIARQTALELEDMWEAELLAYNATRSSSSQTDMSVSRELGKNLILLVRKSKGDHHVWMLPEGSWHEGQTLRQSAQCVLTSICGEAGQSKLLGNAPSACYDYVYTPAVQATTGYFGAKVFIHKVIFDVRDKYQLDGYDDSRWVTRQELNDYLQPRLKAVVGDIILSL